MSNVYYRDRMGNVWRRRHLDNYYTLMAAGHKDNKTVPGHFIAPIQNTFFLALIDEVNNLYPDFTCVFDNDDLSIINPKKGITATFTGQKFMILKRNYFKQFEYADFEGLEDILQ